jgi:hypothetical protein
MPLSSTSFGMTTVPDLQQNIQSMVLTVYADGNYAIQSERDAYFQSATEVDYVTSIPLPTILNDINKVLNK